MSGLGFAAVKVPSASGYSGLCGSALSLTLPTLPILSSLGQSQAFTSAVSFLDLAIGNIPAMLVSFYSMTLNCHHMKLND